VKQISDIEAWAKHASGSFVINLIAGALFNMLALKVDKSLKRCSSEIRWTFSPYWRGNCIA